jgi:hypothetical protein
MSQPQPSPSQQAEPADERAPEAPETAEAEPAAEPEPLNRAARRAKAKQADPSHVGPRGAQSRTVNGGRSHTKRRIS